MGWTENRRSALCLFGGSVFVGFNHQDEPTAAGSATKRQRTSTSSSGSHGDGHLIPDLEVSKQSYADTFGPTTDDLVRLGDTNLFVRSELLWYR